MTTFKTTEGQASFLVLRVCFRFFFDKSIFYHFVKYAESGFSLIGVLPYKNRINDPVLIQGNTHHS